MTMNDNILSFSSQLIKIQSVKSNAKELKSVIDYVLHKLPGFTVEHFEKNGVPSVLVYSGKKRPARFRILLNAHLDVVPATDNQFNPYKKNGRLYGRGTMDMKAAAVVEILLFKELASNLNYPLGLQVVTDEETGGFNGTKYQIEKGVKADFVIAGEPTDFGVNNKAKGIIWVKITVKGASAHGAYPWQGKNAITQMNDILIKINKVFPVPKKETWKTTVNIAKIETSNQTLNKVPDDCTASLDIRYIPEEKGTIIKKLEEVIGNSQLDIVLNEPAQLTAENNRHIKSLISSTKKILGRSSRVIVKPGGSDIRHFNNIGCDGITFGPIGEGLHTDSEWVNIESLKKYHAILYDFLVSQNR